MNPSAVRARIQREHTELRALCDQLDARLNAFALGEDATVDRTLRLTRTLAERLLDHVEMEDLILGPALRDADAWGERREQNMLRHHVQQRAEVAELLATLRSGREPKALTPLMHAFVVELRADMDHEDRALLDPDLLRDDVVGIAVEGG